MRALVLGVVLLVGCGDNLPWYPEQPVYPDAGIDAPPDLSFIDYYGLRLGARWTYHGPGTVVKTITSCELATLPDCHGGQRIERVWVRETRSVDGVLLKVHYLRVVPYVGVVRVREDANGVTRTWNPYEVRLVAGPYVTGNSRTFTSDMCRGVVATKEIQREQVGAPEQITVMGDVHEAIVVTHWDGPTDWRRSWYVRGLGEVREVDDHNGTEELLVGFEPGFADCP